MTADSFPKRHGSDLVFTIVVGLSWLAWFVAPVGVPLAQALADGAVYATLRQEAPRWLGLAENTLILVVLAWAFALPTGAIVGVALARLSPTARRWMPWTLVIGAFAPLALYAGGWQALFDMFAPTGAAARPTTPPWSFVAVAGLHAIAGMPWVAGAVATGALANDRALEEQGLLLAPPSTVAFRVLLPALRPALAFGALLVAAPILTDMTIADLFVVRSLPEETYVRLQLDVEGGERPIAALSALVGFALAAGMLLEIRRHRPARSLADASSWSYPRSPMTVVASHVAAAVVVAAAAPIVGLAWQLGATQRLSPDGASGPMRWRAAAAGHYLSQELRASAGVVATSAASSSAVAAGTTFVAALWAWRWRVGGRATRVASVAAMCGLFALPGPSLGLGILDLTLDWEFLRWASDVRVAMLWGQAARAAPFAFAILAAAFARVDDAVLEAADLEGASQARRLWALATLGPAIPLAFVISAAVALGELPATIILAPPGVEPLSLRIFQLLHVGVTNQQAALCLILLAIVATTAGMAAWLARRWIRAPR